MSNIVICPRNHWFSSTRHGSICPMCGFDVDTPEKVYVNLRKKYKLPLSEDKPVCAFLLCIEGARRGKAYIVSFGINFVGSKKGSEVFILGDDSIKPVHTAILYNVEDKKFYLLPPKGTGMIYIKNKPIYDMYQLKNNEEIEIGKSKFKFLVFDKRYGSEWDLKEFNSITIPKEYEKELSKIKTPEEKYIEKRLREKQNFEEEYPVVGFLVCVSGARKGKAYKLIEEKNYIGRADLMDIQILGDDEIREENHAVIAFDPRGLKAALLGGESKGFVRLNGEAIYLAREMNSSDKLSIGNSDFIYVQIAGVFHRWDKKE